MSEEKFSPKPISFESLENTELITFQHNGKKYEVGPEAYNDDGNHPPIIFPDNTVFTVGSWYESVPPKPADLTEKLDLFKGDTPEETAQLLHGVVAKEVG